MRLVFMGTPDFALTALRAICEAGHDVALVVSQPDKPRGRGYLLTPSPVKKYAVDNGIEVITPATLRDGAAAGKLKSVGADVFIVAAYGKILPPDILSIPPLGCVNIHASLLPAHRGAAPINRAVIEGDTVGGITVMYMDAGMDTGDIIAQRSIPIPPDMTAGEYHDSLAELGGEMITEYLSAAEKGPVPRTPQPSEGVTYSPKIDKTETRADFTRSGAEVCNLIRGLSPYPAAYTVFRGKRIKLLRAHPGTGSGKPGTVISLSDGIEIACGTGSAVVTSLQPEGKGVTDYASYLRGNACKTGDLFGG